MILLLKFPCASFYCHFICMSTRAILSHGTGASLMPWYHKTCLSVYVIWCNIIFVHLHICIINLLSALHSPIVVIIINEFHFIVILLGELGVCKKHHYHNDEMHMCYPLYWGIIFIWCMGIICIISNLTLFMQSCCFCWCINARVIIDYNLIFIPHANIAIIRNPRGFSCAL